MPPFLCAVYQSRYTLTVERFSILIYHSISHLFTLAAGHEMKKKYEQDLGRLLHRCLTQVVPRCSDGFIGNRIAKLILKKKITEDKLIQSAILLKKCPQEGGPFDQAGQWSTSCEGQPQYGGAGSEN